MPETGLAAGLDYGRAAVRPYLVLVGRSCRSAVERIRRKAGQPCG